MLPNEATKVIEGKGRFINRPTKTGKKFYDRFFIYVPTEVARDGTFPFKVREEVNVRIENNRLIIEKMKEQKKE
ncbi:MAG: hypothetical protein AOA66_1070 [Candidatus Bathyarchaeota archaeon BA2]|nr:MAG: hypothetical protein AOA66_1070 [Candidatus Bathyarchaeota archaeon BA2]